MSQSRIVTLFNPIGHPYWQQNQYSVKLPNGKWYTTHSSDFMIEIKNDGIYEYSCVSGSGGGRQKTGACFLVISNREYDKIDYAGRPLRISDRLADDIKQNLR